MPISPNEKPRILEAARAALIRRSVGTLHRTVSSILISIAGPEASGSSGSDVESQSGRLLSRVFDTCVIDRGKGFNKALTNTIELFERQATFIKLAVSDLLLSDRIH